MAERILVVDDDSGVREALSEFLLSLGYEVVAVENGDDALVEYEKSVFDVVMADLIMPNMDGMEAMDRIQEIAPDVPVIMISGHGNIDTAVEAVKKGAFDFIQKPPDLNRMLITIRNAMD